MRCERRGTGIEGVLQGHGAHPHSRSQGQEGQDAGLEGADEADGGGDVVQVQGEVARREIEAQEQEP
jgi:hypothetical protein